MSLTASLNRTRRLGVEYEMAVPVIGGGGDREVQQTIADILNANGVRACWRGYSREPVPDGCDVMVERDGSITGETRFNGVRWAQIAVKTRILNGIDDWEAVVPKTLEILSYCGARVTPSCGHHVHLSFPEWLSDPTRVRSLWNVFHRFDQVIFGLLAPSRRGNMYCRPMRSASKLPPRGQLVPRTQAAAGRVRPLSGPQPVPPVHGVAAPRTTAQGPQDRLSVSSFIENRASCLWP